MEKVLTFLHSPQVDAADLELMLRALFQALLLGSSAFIRIRVSVRILPRRISFVTPLREAVRLVADRITTLIMGEAVDRENSLRSDELKTILEESVESGAGATALDRRSMRRIIRVADTPVGEVMIPLAEVNDILHLDLPTGEAHTIGGIIGNRMRCIPTVGDFIEDRGYRTTVLEADERSVVKVRVE